MSNSDNKNGKPVVVITGAASGLGLSIARKMDVEGKRLVLIDIDMQHLQEIAGMFAAEPMLLGLDITNENEVEAAIKSVVNECGRIDGLVNSAGITGMTNLKSHETNTENVRKVFEVNFMGAYFTSKYVLPVMVQQNYGRILHIASVAGKEGNAGMLAYSASKAAVIGMTKVQGKEYAETGITINAIAPAVIRTALVDKMPAEQVKYMTDKIPMKRCGTLEELADMAAFILSPSCSFTTGFTFDLSGGRATY
jgi:NAD(P)-dependent dehydrogenase (short-subunit alcohol dehydrogenase family)